MEISVWTVPLLALSPVIIGVLQVENKKLNRLGSPLGAVSEHPVFLETVDPHDEESLGFEAPEEK